MTETPTPTVREVKAAVDSLARGFEEFKAANDDRIEEIKRRGQADTVLE